MHLASVTVVARSDPSQTQGSSPQGSSHTDTSFFTFLIALLILVFASGALILRAVLIRRRFRRRVQEAIDAGILPNPPDLQRKPELYEVCVRAGGDAMDWQTLMPICATNMDASEKMDTKRPKDPPHHSTARHIMSQLLGHRLTPGSVSEQPPPSHDHDTDSKYDDPSTVQVAVLIAMPSEHPCIPSLESAPLPVSPKGKQRDSFMNEEVVPDLMFGVSTFAVTAEADD